jgi:cell division topological specificity factor
MGLATLFDRILGRQTADASKNAAKDRLRLVLMHDRSDIPATMMEAIRAEMIQALSKYVEIDTEALDVQLEREQGAIGLVLNIPIRRVKTEAEAADALAAMHLLQTSGTLGKDAAPEAPRDGGEPLPATKVEDDEKPASRDGRDTGELPAGGGTGDLVAERAEKSD